MPLARTATPVMVRSRRRPLGGWAVTTLVGLLLLGAGSAEADPKPARKPGVAFLLSALLPGAGQLYNGDDRGYLYLGVEAGAWFAHYSYQDAGDRREAEYEAYARRHWSLERYRPPYDTQIERDYQNWTASNDSLIVWFYDNDMQQYYEEIGKYDKYRMGWDDWASSYSPQDDRAQSPNRKKYRMMRKQSNDLLDHARLASAVLVVNRMVSAVDAFRTARGRGGPVSNYRLESGFRGGISPRAEIRLVRLLP